MALTHQTEVTPGLEKWEEELQILLFQFTDLPFIFSVLLLPALHLSPFQFLTITERSSARTKWWPLFFSQAAVRLQVQIQSHAGLVRNPFQSWNPHYTHGSVCRQKVTCITWVTQYVSEIFLTLLKNLRAQKRGFHSSITILFTHDNSLIKSYESCRRFYMLI